MNQSPYISHNLNAHDDDKIVALIHTHKATAYGVYWVIVERMGTEPELRLANKPHVHVALARKCNEDVDTIRAVIRTCIEFELFTVEDGDYFFSQSLRERMKIREAAYEKKRRAGKSGADRRWHTNAIAEDSNAMGNDGDAIAPDGTECQREKEEVRREKSELRTEKGEGENTARAPDVPDAKKNEPVQTGLDLKNKASPANQNSKRGGAPKNSAAHLFKDSPYRDLYSFKAAPHFHTAVFKANYPNIDLEYYYLQLARYATGDPQPKKSDWLTYVEGWMSEDKTDNKLRTLKRNGQHPPTEHHRGAAGNRPRTALTADVGGSAGTSKADSF